MINIWIEIKSLLLELLLHLILHFAFTRVRMHSCSTNNFEDVSIVVPVRLNSTTFKKRLDPLQIANCQVNSSIYKLAMQIHHLILMLLSV